MQVLRGASFEEFVRWYVARERQKRRQDPNLGERSWDSLLTEMRGAYPGKLRPWFARGRWNVVLLDTLAEALTLVCVDNPEARRNGLVTGVSKDNRIARKVIARARELNYFDPGDAGRSNAIEGHYRQERIEAYRRSWPQLRDRERVTLCGLNEDERSGNPRGSYYLHDGFGRLVPYLYLVVYEGREYNPVEAFLAEEMA